MCAICPSRRWAWPLSNSVGEKLSAGRVQSPAVRLVVEREKEINAFSSTTHYGAELTFENVDNITDGWKAVWQVEPWLACQDGKQPCSASEGAATSVPSERACLTGSEADRYMLDKSLAEKAAALRTLDVLDCAESESRAAPPAPFTTSTLQQAASSSLKFTPKQTMQLAQRLYEQGAITYHRTDSPNLSQEAVHAIRAYCEAKGWPLVETPRTWKSKEGAQEAHEAIRPTHIEVEEAGETADEQALYRLIRLRSLTSQLADAVFAVRTLKLAATMDGKEALFEAKGLTLVSPGWKVLQQAEVAEDDGEDDTTNPVPAMKLGTKATALTGTVTTKKTKPVARFTESSLIRELEKRGIGRPSTYAAIIDTISCRGYVTTEKRFLVPTALGEKVVSGLCGHFSFIEYEFTRNMEQSLDNIAEGKVEYRAVIASAYDLLSNEVQAFAKVTGKVCEKCGKPMVHRVKKPGKDGKGGYDFWGCSGWPECRETLQFG